MSKIFSYKEVFVYICTEYIVSKMSHGLKEGKIETITFVQKVKLLDWNVK